MQNKTYSVTRLPAGTCLDAVEWSTLPVAHVDTYRWVEGYAPTVTAQLAYIEGECFVLRMTCAEDHPTATYTDYNQPVYKDSCLEFFADWTGDGRYVNMEMNAKGTLLSNVGAGRGNRTPIRDLAGDIFPVRAAKDADGWRVTATIPLSMLADIYGVTYADLTARLVSGYTFRGNFYKCGDETPVPHFGMWNPVGTECPDFHRPAYFGTLILA